MSPQSVWRPGPQGRLRLAPPPALVSCLLRPHVSLHDQAPVNGASTPKGLQGGPVPCAPQPSPDQPLSLGPVSQGPIAGNSEFEVLPLTLEEAARV